MAKRFTDSAKWDDPWFTQLSNEDRLFWTYICDKCDHAGIWKVNLPLVSFYFRGNYYPDLDRFSNRIVGLSEDKWFVPKFIQFQYGELNPDNRVHLSVIQLLKKEGVSKDLLRSLEGPMDKDKDKDKDMDLIKDKDKDIRFIIPPTLEQVQEYCALRNNQIDPETFINYNSSKGWKVGVSPMKDWQAAIRTWEKNSYASSQNSGRVVGSAKPTSGKYDNIEQN